MKKKILLSFDVEEFDILEEYQKITKIDEKTKFEVSNQGLKKLLVLLDKLQITATFFTTANFAIHNKELIKEISKKHEIASHNFYHSSFSNKDIKKSKQTIEKIINKKIKGFRMPRFKKINERLIINADYFYNSSIHPTFFPGRYNNFFKKRKAHFSEKLLNIPISVTPIIRFPISWLAFKNFPLFIIKIASKIILNTDFYLNTYFHPWEFAEISKYNLPSYINKNSGEKLLKKLENYLYWLKNNGEFISFSKFHAEFLN